MAQLEKSEFIISLSLDEIRTIYRSMGQMTETHMKAAELVPGEFMSLYEFFQGLDPADVDNGG